MNKILLVEDDIEINKLLDNFLTDEGFQVEIALDGEAGYNKFLEHSFDLMLLDIMMPKLNGMDVIKMVREKSSVPIIIISAKHTDVDKSLGLGFGADDYITKPFSMIEVLARVKAAIRRSTQYVNGDSNQPQPKQLVFRDLVMNLGDFTVYKGEEEIKLTLKEFEILKLFIQNPKRVFSKAQIYNTIWNEEYYNDENALNVHISRLREKLEDDKKNPSYIITIWGIGYKLGEC